MRSSGGGRRRLRWVVAFVVLLLAEAVSGRSREAEEGRAREKQLRAELKDLRAENKQREKEALKRVDKGDKGKGSASKASKGRAAQAAAVRVSGLSLLAPHNAPGGAPVENPESSFLSGLWRWAKEFFRWLLGRQPTEAEHAVKRAKRSKDWVDSDYDLVDGKYFNSRPPLAFREPVSAERPRGTVFDPAAFGAVPDGLTDSTAAIQRAFDEAGAADGGGVVVLGNGTWLSGPLELRSGVTLWLEGKGSVLKAHGDLTRWPTTPYQEHPLQPAYEPRMRHRPLLGGHSLANVTIAGGGTVHGSGMSWWTKGDLERMRLAPAGVFHALNITNLRIEDVFFVDSPKFSVRPQMCHGVRIRNVVIDNPAGSRGTNGIVIDSCQDVEVTECIVSTGFKEDAMVVKSGEGEYGLRLNAPSRGVTFRGCSVVQGHAISIGSEMSGSVFDTRFEDILFDGRDTHGYGTGSLRVKSARGRGGTVDGVVFKNIRGHKMIHVLQIHAYFGDSDANPSKWSLGRGPGPDTNLPRLQNIVVSNVEVDVSTRTPFIIEGLPDSPITSLVLENVTVRKYGKRGWDCAHYGGCSWAGGGCALGEVKKVEPPPPPECVRVSAPLLMMKR